MCDDTIAAVATPYGLGGIGIIRISGPLSKKIDLKLFKKNAYCSRNDSDRVSHQLVHGYIFDFQGDVVDEVLSVFMAAPNSYTKEDVFEIQSHSGSMILSTILKLVLNCGARLAEPGEFTKRAFINGRIDLSQVEAVIDIIHSKSEAGLKLAARQLCGQTKSYIEALNQKLTHFIAMMEAQIEFGEEVDHQVTDLFDAEQLGNELLAPIQNILNNYHDSHYLRDGVRLGIGGRPNVGKSSLLNRLLLRDRAIVSEYPGTTRDLVEDYLVIKGIPILITDTAGLHESLDVIENLGIQKTKKYFDTCDIVFLVIDASQPFTPEDLDILNEFSSKPIIVVLNKSDLVPSCHEIVIPNPFQKFPVAYISALTGEGIDSLKELFAAQFKDASVVYEGHEIVPNLRQKQLLEETVRFIESAQKAFLDMAYEELILQELICAHNCLNKILGNYVEEDILDLVFSQFCIGK